MIKSSHRADIDGLRALAILPVVFYHAGFYLFPGGYIGVDIFFVISGFLISSILINDISNNTFSFSNFYKRRIRRLAPPLLVMYLCVIIAFSSIYPTFLFDDLIRSIVASMLFISNIFFWKQGGYFATELELQPLLHTWSLSVEEQFYVFFPFLLLLMNKFISSSTKQILLLLVIILTSLLLAIYMAPPRGSFASFYLLPTRIYELGLGALVAMALFSNPKIKIRNVKYFKELGLFLAILPIFIFDSQTPFPSYYALLPVIGSCLIILSAKESGVAYRILTFKPVIYIGLISYSLYLWHWPVIVFNNWIMADLDQTLRATISIIVSLILGSLSFHLIETPFRKGHLFNDNSLVKLFTIGSGAVFTLCAGLFIVGNMKLVDPEQNIEKIYNVAIEPEPTRKECTDKIRKSNEFSLCTLTPKNIAATKKVFVWGDSHASALMPAFNDIAESTLINFAVTTGCPPLIDVKRTDLSQKCLIINQMVFKHILESNYDLVILSAAFNNYLNWGLLGLPSSPNKRDVLQTQSTFLTGLTKTLKSFDKNTVDFLLLAQPPRFNENVPLSYLRQSILKGNYDKHPMAISEYNEQKDSFYELIPKQWKKNIVDTSSFFCSKDTCRIASDNNELLYKDKHHISNYQAKSMSKWINNLVEKRLHAAHFQQKLSALQSKL
jgi:peptidoglycan/LPS O-acetylase OafA/YrhL